MEPVLQRAGLFVPGRNCYAVAHADRLTFLVDGEAYFRAFAQAAERARRSIVIVAWDFNSSARLRFDKEEERAAPPARLGEFLNWLARRRRRLRIFVLDWDYPMVFGTDREFPPGHGVGWVPHRRVHVRYDDTHPVGGSHHQKIVIIDGALAFVGGFDLTARRWDTPDHRPDEARRAHGQDVYPPFHDLMAVMDGEAARALGRIARERWQAATGKRLAADAGDADPWPADLPVDTTDVDLAIARTFPPAPGRPLVREVEQLYLDMIAAARHTIYIENQYFTAHAIGEALAARLAEAEGPQVILVTRLLSHGWLEEHTMHVLRTRLFERLTAADRGRRFHAYHPHIDGLRNGTCIDVHSKVMIVDDAVLRIGSANLCNRSMGMDSECDIAVEARGDTRVTAVIQNFRNRLLGEHLGVPPARVGREIARHGGLYEAIRSLQSPGRTLRPLDKMPEWSDAVVQLARVADPGRPVFLEEPATDFRPAHVRPPQGVHWARLATLVLAVVALASLWRYTPLAGFVSPERIIDWADSFARQPWAPIAVLLAYTPGSMVMFPRALITLAAVVAFGPFPGIAYAVAGGLLAAFFSYLAGRRLPGHTVRNLVGDNFNGVTELLRRRGLMAMTAVRLVPVMPFAAVGLLAGAIRIRFRHFMLGTLLGMVPGTLTAVIFGEQFEVALRNPSEISYGLVALALGVMALLAFTVARWLKAQSRHD